MVQKFKIAAFCGFSMALAFKEIMFDGETAKIFYLPFQPKEALGAGR